MIILTLGISGLRHLTSNVHSISLFLEIDVHTKYVFLLFYIFHVAKLHSFHDVHSVFTTFVSKPDGTKQIIQEMNQLATVFCKISVRRSANCLTFSIA